MSVRVHSSGGPSDVLLAACLWGTTGTVRTFVPTATNLSIAAIRIVLGGLVLATVSGHRRHLVRAPRNWLPLGLGAAAMLTYQTAFFNAADRTGVAVSTVVTIGSAPAFTGLLGLAIGQARLTRRWLLASSGAVAGCAALVGGGGGAGAEPVGIGLALLSGLAYAVYATVVAALISRGEADRAVTGAVFALAAVIAAPALLTGPTTWMLTPRGALIAVYLGVVTTAGGYLLFARGLRSTPAATATTLTLAEPAVAAVLGVVILHERLAPVAVGGLALLAASLALLAVPGPGSSWSGRAGRGESADPRGAG